MKKQKTHREPLRAKTQCRGYSDTLPEQIPALDAIFVGLARGETPDVLTFLAGISEMVVFETKCDSSESQLEMDEIFMSQNKCRLCP